MKSFTAFLKKEWMHFLRSGHLWIFLGIFVLFGIMNPVIAKLTPWMMEMMAESLEETGFTMAVIKVDAMTSWTQFFKNIPMALIAFVIIQSNLFTKEYQSGTLVLALTKGLDRYKVVIAKFIRLFTVWTVGYWLCYGVTYVGNTFFWNNDIANALAFTAFNWWLFGVWIISLMILFSVIASNNIIVMLGTGGSILVVYLLGLLPWVKEYMPTTLMNTANLLFGVEKASEYGITIVVTFVLCVVAIGISIPIINKRKI